MRLIDANSMRSGNRFGGKLMVYVILFLLVFKAFLILEIVRGMDDE